MPEDTLDLDELERIESDAGSVRARLQARKLPASDDIVDQLQQAASARLRVLGV